MFILESFIEIENQKRNERIRGRPILMPGWAATPIKFVFNLISSIFEFAPPPPQKISSLSPTSPKSKIKACFLPFDIVFSNFCSKNSFL